MICYIWGAGDPPVSFPRPTAGDLVIAADAGYRVCRTAGITPDLLLGDFDSMEEPEDFPNIRRVPVEKDDTDTMAAIRYGMQAGCREFHLYAAMGGRLEHTIANLQTLLFLKKNGAKGYLWDAFSMTTVICNESISFRESMEGILSVFAMGGDAKGVTETGLKYQLQDALLENSFPKGISNEFIGEEATVSVKDGSLLILARWE